MEGVSGVSGAGPLLHRAVLAVARRYPLGALPSPRSAGAVPALVCRLSGARPGPACPTATEWFAPTHVPGDACRWHDGLGGVRLPVEYAEWRAGADAAPPEPAEPTSAPADGFRILSPVEGDVYRLPPGVEARYATVALRAAGGSSGTLVRWTVDGEPHRGARWALRPGRHRFLAVSAGGDSAAVTVSVE
jgi:penicillin-binding protein 1C